ncbi:hypothetical protein D3C75_1146280 [compost metagenome]
MSIARQMRMAGILFTKGKDNLQMTIFGRLVARWEVEIFGFKAVQRLFGGQQKGHGVQQAGLAPGIFPE